MTTILAVPQPSAGVPCTQVRFDPRASAWFALSRQMAAPANNIAQVEEKMVPRQMLSMPTSSCRNCRIAPMKKKIAQNPNIRIRPFSTKLICFMLLAHLPKRCRVKRLQQDIVVTSSRFSKLRFRRHSSVSTPTSETTRLQPGAKAATFSLSDRVLPSSRCKRCGRRPYRR